MISVVATLILMRFYFRHERQTEVSNIHDNLEASPT